MLAPVAGPRLASAESHELPPPGTRAWQTGLLRADRLEHTSLAWTIGLGTGLATREPALAIATPALLGLAKEIADRHTTGFDMLDLTADLIGAAAAGVVAYRWKE